MFLSLVTRSLTSLLYILDRTETLPSFLAGNLPGEPDNFEGD